MHRAILRGGGEEREKDARETEEDVRAEGREGDEFLKSSRETGK